MSQRKRRRRFFGFGLRARLLIYFTALVFGAVGMSTWLLTLRGQGMAANSLADMTSAVARSLALSAALTHDPDALREITQAQLSGEQILSAAIIDGDGNTIASAGRDGVDAGAMRVRSDVGPRHIETAAGDALVVVTPIVRNVQDEPGKAVANRVVVVASMRSIGRSTRAMVELVALVGSGVTSTAALLAWVLVHRARRPLRELVASVRAVTAGKADAVSETHENEQVAEVASAFNEMVDSIRDNREQLSAANSELAATVRGLEQKIVDRTAQLEVANDRLSGEIAEKEDFLRAVSHDLNAPLRNIAGMVSMLLTKNRDTLAEDVVGRLERIGKNVDVEADLINELLELSRIKTRKQSLERVDTEAVVWELRGTFENDLKTRQIELIVETSLPPLWAERARVRQIFQNLIDNAIKYMGDGPHPRDPHRLPHERRRGGVLCRRQWAGHPSRRHRQGVLRLPSRARRAEHEGAGEGRWAVEREEHRRDLRRADRSPEHAGRRKHIQLHDQRKVHRHRELAAADGDGCPRRAGADRKGTRRRAGQQGRVIHGL